MIQLEGRNKRPLVGGTGLRVVHWQVGGMCLPMERHKVLEAVHHMWDIDPGVREEGDMMLVGRQPDIAPAVGVSNIDWEEGNSLIGLAVPAGVGTLHRAPKEVRSVPCNSKSDASRLQCTDRRRGSMWCP